MVLILLPHRYCDNLFHTCGSLHYIELLGYIVCNDYGIDLFELPWIVASTFLFEPCAKALSKHDASISICSKRLVQLLITIVLSYKNP